MDKFWRNMNYIYRAMELPIAAICILMAIKFDGFPAVISATAAAGTLDSYITRKIKEANNGKA